MSIKEMPLEFRIQLHKELITYGIIPSCLNCIHTDNTGVRVGSTIKATDPQNVMCEKFKVQPPLQIVACGCPDWVEGIPF